jgi:hypothetical protein
MRPELIGGVPNITLGEGLIDRLSSPCGRPASRFGQRRSRLKKRADVVQHTQVLNHVGLLVNVPPVTAALPFIQSSDNDPGFVGVSVCGLIIAQSPTPRWPCIRFLFVGSELPSWRLCLLASFGFGLAADTLA